MADIFDTLKKHSDRVKKSESKSKKVNRTKTRPWHDYTVANPDPLSREQERGSDEVSIDTSKGISPTPETSHIDSNESVKLRKQYGNNTDTDVYVNKSVYVNNTETGLNESADFIDEYSKNRNKTETDVYVNKLVYVNNTETISGPSSLDVLKNLPRTGSNKSTETDVYVNSTETIASAKGSTNGLTTNIIDNTETPVYVNKAVTERKQYGNQAVTKRKQNDNRAETIGKQQGNSKHLNTETRSETDRKQMTPADLVYSLPRSEEKILKFIVELCLNSASLTTPKLNYRLISSATQITEKSCKTLMGRLKNKNILKLESYTKGPGSYSIFSITQEVYNNFLYISGKSVLFDLRKQNVNNTQTQSPPSAETNLSSKLVSNYNNTNNTSINVIYDFIVEDLRIEDLRMLGISSKAVGDSIRNLTKFLDSNESIKPLSKEDFQDFIDKFVEYANSRHGKTMKSKSAIFIGEIQRFQKEGTCSTIDWHNDKEYEVYEQFVKEQELKTQRKTDMLEKAIEYTFLDWRNTKTKEELIELIPESHFSKYGNPGYELEAKKYFRENIWEEKRKELNT